MKGHPLKDAFVSTAGTGDPEPANRTATLKIAFRGAGSLQKVHAARDYLDALVKSDTGALSDIAAERRRQVEAEGWTHDHDDSHDDGSLAMAAAAYAVNAANPNAQIDVKVGRRGEWFNGGWMGLARLIWPKEWDRDWWKPKSARADLVRAGALIVAEIERLDRAQEVVG